MKKVLYYSFYLEFFLIDTDISNQKLSIAYSKNLDQEISYLIDNFYEYLELYKYNQDEFYRSYQIKILVNTDSFIINSSRIFYYFLNNCYNIFPNPEILLTHRSQILRNAIK